MTTQLLLTDELKATMPETVKVAFNFGRVVVMFPPLEGYKTPLMMYGDNAIVEAETDVMIKWLKPFDGVAIGNGVPQMENFEIMHINENL
jgi:hypothetical protein